MPQLLYNHASNLENANGSSGAFSLPGTNRVRNRLAEGLEFSSMAAFAVKVDANVTAFAGTTPGVQFILETTWDGVNWVAAYTSAVITATGVQPTVVVGAGATLLGPQARLRWVISGTVGPSATFTASVNTLN